MNLDRLREIVRQLVAGITFAKAPLYLVAAAAFLYKKLAAMDVATLTKLKAAIDNKCIMFEEITDEEQALINRLSFTEDEINELIEECKTYYGEPRIMQPTPIQMRQQFLEGYPALIRLYAHTAVGEFPRASNKSSSR